jgi:hypothetical protein
MTVIGFDTIQKATVHTEGGDNSESTVGEVLAETNGTCIHKAKIQINKLWHHVKILSITARTL